ncbi:hypothetical protein EDD18DRAFT_1352291 [Armillaria luteobubalina]|uniref:Endonuclease/exonuclease/phosphatase domain-containing protein n=1 Tax=Armillaria luteobubalina TaxID=153913 RepID=A0AA39UP61_9AGAR|nr:hypothetical protein EDD18DRAFT_1352291 [Armillaria luteobubalina]
MALDGDTYVIVLKSWELTSQLLSQSLPHPRGLPTHIKLSNPILLYFFNGCGCLASPQYLTSSPSNPSPDNADLQKQIDLLREQGMQSLSVTNRLIDTQTDILHNLHLSSIQTRSALTASANCQTAASQLSTIEADLAHLRSQLNMKQTMLLVITDLAMRSVLTAQAEVITAEIDAKCCLRVEAEQHVFSLMGAMHAAIAQDTSSASPSVQPALDHNPAPEEPPRQRQCIRESSPSEEEIVQSSLMPVDDGDQVHISPSSFTSFSYCLCPQLPYPSWNPQGLIPICALNISFPPFLYQVRSSHAARALSLPSISPQFFVLLHKLSFPLLPFWLPMYFLLCITLPSSWLVLLYLFLLLPSVNASSVSSFMTVAMNVNGFTDVMKTSSVNNALLSHQPHACVLAEMKSLVSVSNKFCTRAYKFIDSPGIPTDRSHTKWGISLAVHRSLATLPLDIPPHLCGRVVGIDIVFPTTSGSGYRHRLIGVYAPYDPGIDTQVLANFWDAIQLLCSTNGFNNAWVAYQTFVLDTHVVDVWVHQGDNDVTLNCTYSSYNGSTRSIIDRCAHSQLGVLSSTINVPNTFIPGTDHHLITLTLHCIPPPALSGTAALLEPESSPPCIYQPRFLFPKRQEANRFQTFADRVDGLISDANLVLTDLTNDYNMRHNIMHCPRFFTWLLRSALISHTHPIVRLQNL